MKNVLLILTFIVLTQTAFAQRVFIQPTKSNDTINIKIFNEKFYRVYFIKDNDTIYKKQFAGVKIFTIHNYNYKMTRKLDTINKVMSLIFIKNIINKQSI